MKLNFDVNELETPYYIVDEKLLTENLEILAEVKKRSGCKILLAQKAFSMFSEYPLISKYLDGTTSSGIFEAKLGHDRFGKETHVFAPVYKDEDFDSLLKISNHIIFNSFSQWIKYRQKAVGSGKSFGLRINPEHSTQDHKIYDPCYKFSRMGITEKTFDENLEKYPGVLDGIDGFHMHTLCEQNSDALSETFDVFEKKFGRYLKNMKWLNLGGGHHITRGDYDIETLISVIKHINESYGIQVYLEPGEAVALNTGFLVCTVCDVISNGMEIAVIDSSAACHMPDVLEMPYRPHIIGSGIPDEKKYTYRIAGNTCLAGDIVGDYSFDRPLRPGDRLVFTDMAHYSMVKNNTFNGIPLPSIAKADINGETHLVKKFGYKDFEERLS